MQTCSSTSVPKKRMRLGTRSCAECRRRKVRCIYLSNSEICQQCEAHCTPCQKQGTPKQQAAISNGDSVEGLKDRVQHLERLVGQLCGGQGLVPHASGRMSPAAALSVLCPTSVRNVQTGLLSRDAGTEGQPVPSDGPLLGLMYGALAIDSAVQSPGAINSREGHGSQAFYALKALALRNEDLQLALAMTEKYWPLWPILPPRFIQVVPSQGGALARKTALEFVQSSFQSSIPEVMAKGVLWLALCIQQLPSEFDFRPHNLPCHRSVLLEAYMAGAEDLLRSPHDTQTTTTFLECLMLQTKLCINMARPRKAWLTVRRALDFALLQGAQRVHSGPLSETLRSLWLEIWVFDRQLSLGLGLPNSVADSHARLVNLPDGDFSAWMFRLIGAVAGRINDRNLNIADVDYAVTMEIERELVDMRDRIPAEWDLPNTDEMCLADVFTKQVGKFYLNLLLKNLHFPYMVRSPTNNVQQAHPHSRATAVQAARRMIEQYQGLRRSKQGALLICDIMDFHTFTGAIVLIVHLISPPDAIMGGRDIQQDRQDWMQVQELIQTFEHLSLAMTCAVAKQAADLLGYLYAAAHGFYHGEPYEVVIPYFGKVRISPPTREQQQRNSSSASTSCIGGDVQVSSPSPFSSIEFNAQTFCPQGPNIMGLGCDELGTDWSLFSRVEVDADWTEVFTIPMNDIP
ncbi:hypothetical protein BJX68DRAFT_114763 [Aspergillus pseudodeflectus]|uniref:Zn(2)-C6 fungal-type domain-containing protein n=1 Tax=Aspergillus pseudodeflectus TaxID=176178 RepID=A0ABR4L4F0_9EURO